MGQRMINARSETLLEKPSFRQAVQKRRCLIPANGFYEWRSDGQRKVPMWIQLKSRELLPFLDSGTAGSIGRPENRYTVSRSLRHTPMHYCAAFMIGGRWCTGETWAGNGSTNQSATN